MEGSSYVENGVEIHGRQLVFASLVVQMSLCVIVAGEHLGVGGASLGVALSIVRPVVALIVVAFAPGTLVALLLGVSGRSTTKFAAYSFGSSLVVAMVVGATISIVYPLFGFAHPMTDLSFALSLLGVSVSLGVIALEREPGTTLRLPIGELFSPFPLALLLLPMVSVYGSLLYQIHGNNLLLLGMFTLVALFPIVVALERKQSRWYPFVVWMVALALVYQTGDLLGPYHGAHADAITTMNQDMWTPESSLLSNGVLYPSVALLMGVPVVQEWVLINPFLMSFTGPILFVSFRRYMSGWKSFVTVGIFMFSWPFFVLLPGGGRIGTPILFLALLALVTTDEQRAEVTKPLALTFAFGLAVSHYGTSYVVMFAFLVAMTALFALKVADSGFRQFRVVDRYVKSDVSETGEIPNGGTRFRFYYRLLTPGFVGFFTTLTLSWYLYTARGDKFYTLISHVRSQIRGVLYGEFTGSAAGAVRRDFGTPAISMSKDIYLVIGALMALGILVAVIYRIVLRRPVTDEEHLALAIGFMAMLAASFLPGGDGFNVARVVMIVFAFTAPYAVIAVDGVTGAARALLERVNYPYRTRGGLDPERIGEVGLAVLLSVFLLLNSGVVTEAVTKEYAPNRGISEARLANSEDPQLRIRSRTCISCNIETHVWILTHHNPDVAVFGDNLAYSQVDFFRGTLQSRTGNFPEKAFYVPIWSARNGTDGRAYLVLLPHNLDTDGVLVGSRYNWRQLDGLRPVIEEANVIYTTGESKVYLTQGRGDAPRRNATTPNDQRVTTKGASEGAVPAGIVRAHGGDVAPSSTRVEEYSTKIASPAETGGP